MSDKFNSTLNECKEYKNSIMSNIKDVLYKHEYKIKETEKLNEILVFDNNLSNINTIIREEVNVSKSIYNMLIDTYQTKEGIYIRLKFK